MTQTVSQMNSARIRFNPRLQELLESDRFDWDDLRHREAYLKAWINRPIKQQEEES